MPLALAAGDPHRLGALAGTSVGDPDTVMGLRSRAQDGAPLPSRAAFHCLDHSAACVLSSLVDIRGPVHTTTGCDSGLDALGQAGRAIQAGAVDVVNADGSSSVLHDRLEGAALGETFGERLRGVRSHCEAPTATARSTAGPGAKRAAPSPRGGAAAVGRLVSMHDPEPPAVTDHPHLPVTLTFAGLAGEADGAAAPTVMPRAAGEALRDFFEAHPTVEFVQFEIALNDDGDDLEFAGGTLHVEGGAPLREGREARRAAEAFRRLLREDPHLAALPVALVIAMGGIEHTFRITRDATGAKRPEGQSADADERAAARERARLRERDARYDQRDDVRDDDHVA